MTSADLPAAGQLFAGRYRLESRLGEGAFGEVWLSHDLVRHSEVVVKLLHRQWARVPQVIERFRREAEASHRVHHPSACQVYEFALAADDRPFITMEYLAGGTLRQELDRVKRMPLPRVATWMVPVCEAVAVAHGAGIVHRDLKPENIMMRREGPSQSPSEVPVVLDFGIAKIVDADNKLTQTGSILGSPAYMSPEQALGSADLGPGADVYSLAIIVFELCTGKPPFESRSFAELAVQHAHDRPPPLVGVPPALAEVVARCLTKDAGQRPRVLELSRALARAAWPEREAQRARAAPTRIVDRHSAPTVISAQDELQQGLRRIERERWRAGRGSSAPAEPPSRSSSSVARLALGAAVVVALAALGVLLGLLVR